MTSPLAAHTTAAQHRILTAAEKRTLPLDAALPLIRERIRRLNDPSIASITDRCVLGVLADLVDVVEQIAEQVQP